MAKKQLAKILAWDLETTDFKGNKGHLLTAAAKWVGDDYVYTWRIDDHKDYGKTPKSFMDDSWIVEDLVEMISEADMLVHHFGDRFDLPFLTTRALANGVTPPPKIRTVDTWKVARSKLAMTSNRLKSLCAFLCDEQKEESLDISDWMAAEHGDKKILTKMMAYNVQDVVALEELYLTLRPVMDNHPYVAVAPEGSDPRLHCPACGSTGYSTGSYYTKLYHVKRRRCGDPACSTPWEESRSKKG